MAAKGKGLGPHPGFQALVKSGVPAGALADSSRNASAKAKKANPRLKKVPMKGQKVPPKNMKTAGKGKGR